VHVDGLGWPAGSVAQRVGEHQRQHFRDLASGPMLGLGSSPHERIGQGPSWAGDMVST
jgi:hypothetical protein